MLVSGWANDDRFHLARAVDPDWEWKQLGVFFASQSLHALHNANWQRGGGKGKRPKLVTARLLRGESDEDLVSKSGVKAGRRRGDQAVAVSGVGAFADVRARLAERRAKHGTQST